ncbi:gamma-glutamyltransferase 1 [Nemania sp. FL0031]|nr:gamma-glutamyltransferase 1 [Nemania sp. FL0031]
MFYAQPLSFIGLCCLARSVVGGHHPSMNIPKHGAVASENSQCSQIGIEMLKSGGNAADAMVGTVFCVGVVNVMHSGIGGGGFMLVRSDNGTYEFIDFRETAPAAAFENMYTNNTDASLYGGLASGIPGELRGLEYLHKHYGRLPWAQVMSPAIKLARYGFRVNEDLVKAINSTSPADFLTKDPAWAIDFAPNGRLVRVNETITRKWYADLLESISERGADVFYSGPIANATIAALQGTGGTMTLEDLKDYTIVVRKPSNITYGDYRITSCGAPAGGSVVLSILNILQGYKNIGNPLERNLTTHRLDEAMKFAYGERTNLGDPSYVSDVLEYQDSMLSAETAAEIRSKISDGRTHTNISYYDPAGIESLNTHGTSYLATADHTGLAISLTTTINTLFGSQVMVPETGVAMNNEMNDFSIPGSSNVYGYRPSPVNYIRPGKRPLSSMASTIVETALDGRLYLVIGSAGGSRIITATAQNLHHVLDENQNVAQALGAPRFHDQLVPTDVEFEYAYDNNTVSYMIAVGVNATWVAPGDSEAQAIRLLPNGTFEAAGEPRQFNSGGFAI